MDNISRDCLREILNYLDIPDVLMFAMASKKCIGEVTGYLNKPLREIGRHTCDTCGDNRYVFPRGKTLTRIACDCAHCDICNTKRMCGDLTDGLPKCADFAARLCCHWCGVMKPCSLMNALSRLKYICDKCLRYDEY